MYGKQARVFTCAIQMSSEQENEMEVTAGCAVGRRDDNLEKKTLKAALCTFIYQSEVQM